jgi:hypothetical protein
MLKENKFAHWGLIPDARESVSVTRHLQIFEDEPLTTRAHDPLEKVDRWVTEFIARLSRLIQDMGRRK